MGGGWVSSEGTVGAFAVAVMFTGLCAASPAMSSYNHLTPKDDAKFKRDCQIQYLVDGEHSREDLGFDILVTDCVAQRKQEIMDNKASSGAINAGIMGGLAVLFGSFGAMRLHQNYRVERDQKPLINTSIYDALDALTGDIRLKIEIK